MNIHSKRIKDLQKLLKREKLDALVLGRTLETGFLTGFHLDGLLMLVSRSSAWAFMPKMLLADFSSKVDFVRASSPDSLLDGVAAAVKENSSKGRRSSPRPKAISAAISGRNAAFSNTRGLPPRCAASKRAKK